MTGIERVYDIISYKKNMVVVKILGGFASQLGKFCFAYEVAKAKGTEVYIDISDFADGYFRPFMLQYLNLPDCKCINGISGIKNIRKIKDGAELLEVFEQETFPDIYIYKEEGDYQAFLDKYSHMKMQPSQVFFENLGLRVESDTVKQFRDEVCNTDSVAVHVRRGDFVTLGWEDETAGYKGVIGYLMQKNPNTQFYFFSNDLEWVKKTYGYNDAFHYVEHGNGYLGDVEEFFCLAMCKDKILSSVSGFSLYANYFGMSRFATNKAYVLKNSNNEFVQQLGEEQMNAGRAFFEENVSEYKEDKFVEKVTVEQRINRCNVTNNEGQFSSEEKQDFWKEVYKLENECKKKIVLITCERYDRWRWSGMFMTALVLSRIGHEVLYVNIQSSYYKANLGIQVAEDMEGNDLGFLLGFPGYDMSNIKDLISQFGSDVYVVGDILTMGEIESYKDIARYMLNVRYVPTIVASVLNSKKKKKACCLWMNRKRVEWTALLNELKSEEDIFAIAEKHAIELAGRINLWCNERK